MSDAPKLSFAVHACRIDAHGGEAPRKGTAITIDTDLAGSRDAFDAAGLLLARAGPTV